MSEKKPAERKPRSQKHGKISSSAKVNSIRTKKKNDRIPWRVMIILGLVLLIAVLGLVISRSRLTRLDRERKEAQAAYEREVERHTVAYRGWIEKYANENGIEPAYVAAIILRESSYDPRATSSVGARGLMQLMPNTFEQVRNALKENTTFDDMYDAETNIRYGCWYLGYLSRIFNGDPIEMACAYHAGPNNVKLWIMNYAADGKNLQLDEIPMEDTRYYAGKVLNAYAIYFQHYYPDPA